MNSLLTLFRKLKLINTTRLWANSKIASRTEENTFLKICIFELLEKNERLEI